MRSITFCLQVLLLGLALGSAPGQVLATAHEEGPVIRSELERRAETLLEIAVQHVRDKGEAGTKDFSRQSAFVDRDLYAFALRTDGIFLASGGASAAFVGQNVLGETDSEGKPYFREMVDIAMKDGAGRVEYRWFNPADSRGDPRLTLFRKVGEVIVAVGFYPPRGTPTQARAMLKDAIKELDRDAAAALSDFQHLTGRFIRNDLYVFVVDEKTGRFLAHGATPALVGTNGFDIQDPTGRFVIGEMMKTAKKEGAGELDYYWRNPTTGRIESKHTFFRLHRGRLVGVGSYNR